MRWTGLGIAMVAVMMAAPTAASADALELGAWAGPSHSSQATARSASPRAVVSGPSSSPHRGRTAAAGGISVRAPTELPWLGVRADLALAPKGYSAPTLPYVRATYVEMPILAELAYLSRQRFAMTFLGGLAPAYRATCTATGSDYEASCGEGSASTRDRRALDLGAVLGLGARLQVGAGTAFVELRNVYGLIDAEPSQSGTTINLAAGALLGYRLAL